MGFDSLDFIYHPSRDVKRDLGYFTDVLGGRLRFAVEGMGVRVAAVELAPTPPVLLLADHVEGDTPILVYRVANLRRELTELKRRGWSEVASFEIPHGPLVPHAGRPADRRIPADAAGRGRDPRGTPGLLTASRAVGSLG